MDLYWFVMHMYKMDLEKSMKNKNNIENPNQVEINRLTYKKMLRYFDQKNE